MILPKSKMVTCEIEAIIDRVFQLANYMWNKIDQSLKKNNYVCIDP